LRANLRESAGKSVSQRGAFDPICLGFQTLFVRNPAYTVSTVLLDGRRADRP
jgi:hypothetical protein